MLQSAFVQFHAYIVVTSVLRIMKNCYWILITFVICSCKQDDDSTNHIKNTSINLQMLEEGQRSMFLRLDGNCGLPESYGYTQDTLVLEVFEENSQLQFREYFTYGSPLFETSPDPIIYPVHIHENFILIPEREQSTLFFFYGNDTIFTNPEPEIDLQQEGCMPMKDGQIFDGDAIAFLPEFALHDISLQKQTVVSCVPVIFELEAYLCYRNGKLNLSYTLGSGFPTISFQGWRLVE